MWVYCYYKGMLMHNRHFSSSKQSFIVLILAHLYKIIMHGFFFKEMCYSEQSGTQYIEKVFHQTYYLRCLTSSYINSYSLFMFIYFIVNYESL